MMFLAIDIGNSHVTCGIFYEGKWIHTVYIPSNLNFWNQFITLQEYKIKDAAISSVVPQLTMVYMESIKNIFHTDALIISHENARVDLKVDVPKEVGIDRVCNTAAAAKLIGCPAIIGDIGSATNYDVVDEKGSFIGGAIAPGIEVAAQNLIKRAALLEKTTFIIPKTAVGKSTDSNLQSGIMLGAIDVIDGMFKRIKSETGWNDHNNIITGGFGELISPHLNTEHTLIPTLTLDGIRIIFEKSSQSSD